MVKNVELSKQIGYQINAQAKQCWQNSVKAVSNIKGAIYVEGHVVHPSGLVFEHGWIELDNEIVDPTLVEDIYTYFPAIKYSKHNIPKKCELPLARGTDWGFSNLAYMTSLRDAHRSLGTEFADLEERLARLAPQ